MICVCMCVLYDVTMACSSGGARGGEGSAPASSRLAWSVWPSAGSLKFEV